jgi:uncharacterized membrane protein YeaQ/YmgE (transglycosylase-associated protein family)
MAILVWFTLGVALWHFAVFVPDRFKGGIVGAFLAAVIGAMVTGAIWQIATGDSIGQTDVVTLLAAVPGCILAMVACWYLGEDLDEEPV